MDSVSPTFSLNIGLTEAGDSGSAYHFLNDPSDPLQRKNWAERQSVVDIRASCLGVLHGELDPQDPSNPVPCTLLLLEFRFDPRKPGRRITWSQIKLKFSSMEVGQPDPEVTRIAPLGRLTFAPTSKEQSTTTGTEVSAGLGTLCPIDVGSGFTWSRSVNLTIKDTASVVGSIDTIGRIWGKKNGASWTLDENKMSKSGVPSLLKAAVLLLRESDDGPFKCEFSITAKADWKTDLQSLFGKTPPDDPVIFDPSLEPIGSLRLYDQAAIGAIDLDSLSDITQSTEFGGVTKIK